MSDQVDRKNVMNLLRRDIQQTWYLSANRIEFRPLALARELEANLHTTCENAVDYTSKLTRTIFILRNGNPNVVMERLAKRQDVLHCIDELLVETKVKRWKDQVEAHETRFNAMLKEKYEELKTSGGESDALLTCTSCGSANVIFDQVQTRSADEGMTIIACCLKCGRKWREN